MSERLHAPFLLLMSLSMWTTACSGDEAKTSTSTQAEGTAAGDGADAVVAGSDVGDAGSDVGDAGSSAEDSSDKDDASQTGDAAAVDVDVDSGVDDAGPTDVLADTGPDALVVDATSDGGSSDSDSDSNADAVVTPACKVDTDCAGKLLVGESPCQQEVCSNGTCVVADANAGEICKGNGEGCDVWRCKSGSCAFDPTVCPCDSSSKCLKYDSGNACLPKHYCDLPSGACKLNPSSGVVCDSSQDTTCLKNLCDPAVGTCGMTPQAEGQSCDDGNKCTDSDTCKSGTCQGGVWVCPCTSDEQCQAKEDGDACNGTLYCKLPEGSCVINPATIVTCPTVSDGACRKTVCNPKVGKCELIPVNEGGACDDGIKCTSDEVCEKGDCTASLAMACQCTSTADCAVHEDGDACNGTLYCDKQSNSCKVNPNTVVDCPSANDSVCAKNVCDPSTGACQLVLPKAVTGCDDGDPCTQSDTCQDGKCVGSPSSDTCECKSDQDCGKYDDGNLCNGVMYCEKASGKCAVNPATVVVCPSVADTTCSHNVCEPTTGKCGITPRNQGQACDDGDPTTKADWCDAGTCKSGAVVVECKSDQDCVDTLGATNLCFQFYCDNVQNKCVSKAPVVCAPGGDTNCQKNVCNPTTGKCGMVPVNLNGPCSDDNACTLGDACDAKGNCAPGTIACCFDDEYCNGPKGIDDGDKCNGVAYCDKSQPAPHWECKPKPQSAVVCSVLQDTVCAKNTCVPATGLCAVKPIAAMVAKPCDDENPCTVETLCLDGLCAGKDKDCNDDNSCTTDSCGKTTDCVHAPVAATPCDDGDACSVGEGCKGGSCGGGAPTDCDDGNPCTTDGCAAETGCSHVSTDGPCDDGAACTVGDGCAAGTCQPGAQKNCDDGNGCTMDACTAADGQCSHVALAGGATCSDADVCTQVDGCDGKGACIGTTPLACADGNACTDDGCDAVKGCVYPNSKSGVTCDDAAACTALDACDGKGTCVGKPRLGSFTLSTAEIQALHAVVEGSKGGVVALGEEHGSGGGPAPALVVGFDAAGAIAFQQTHALEKLFANAGGQSSGFTGAVLQTNGSIMASGYSSNNAGDGVVAILSASDGKVMNAANFGSVTKPDRLDAITSGAAGEFVVVGRTQPGATDDAWVLRIDGSLKAIGTPISFGGASSVYSGDAADALLAVASLSAGGYVAVGTARRPAPFASSIDGVLQRFDANLKPGWPGSDGKVGSAYAVQFGGRAADRLDAVIDTGSAIWAAGAIGSRSHGATDGWLLAVDATGKLLWEKSLGDDKVDELRVLLPIWKDGTFLGAVAAGNHSGCKGTCMEGWALRLDRDGQTLWQASASFDATGNTVMAGTLLADGSLALVGHRALAPGAKTGAWLWRLDGWGNTACSSSGACAVVSAPSCDDGDACTTDACAAAKGCVNSPLLCDDGIAETVDACDKAKGCTHDWTAAIGKPCGSGKNWVWSEEHHCAPPGMVRIDPLPQLDLSCYPPLDGACNSDGKFSYEFLPAPVQGLKPYFMRKYEGTAGDWNCAYANVCPPANASCSDNQAWGHAFSNWAHVCYALGMRPPTPAELQRARRGPYGYRYVWGNEEPPSDACTTCAYGYNSTTCPNIVTCDSGYDVTKTPALDRSFEGVVGLAGGHAELGEEPGQWAVRAMGNQGSCGAGDYATMVLNGTLGSFKKASTDGAVHCVLPVEKEYRWKRIGNGGCNGSDVAETNEWTPWPEKCNANTVGKVAECSKDQKCWYKSLTPDQCKGNGGYFYQCVFEGAGG
ncbi:MAG: hypothetical protein H6747_11305 [Deltaproteobacteria bacterium]|nr:hypothetical protein [Deltaproteobacteria bacterium]